eukprot:CAMPEP_0119007346 /NCGR_PEP_ID=MMETSP1176-20130426/2950_1 /TAXON_ID=265551 /ORGANISM="Synedropsis recta cf, Strain CCMP1620" /LENGTH=368 /DNA_ID=CAMNT_0006959473 /DNA_START=77 /DNA_END=1183 /DNA_ORIENTATION=+
MVVARTTPPVRAAPATATTAELHPSTGVGHAYSHEFRQAVQWTRNTGHGDNPLVQDLRTQRLWPVKRTERRHRHRYQMYGHLRRFVRQGNQRATVLRGIDGFLLCYYRAVYPTCTQAEMIAFLWNAYGRHLPEPRFFDTSQISRAEDRFGISRKRGSTTARQALLPINVAKRNIFWMEPYPNGIADTHLNDQIDIDECGLYIETAARHIGKAAVGVRVREPGPYGHSEKYTLLMAISDRPGPHDRFVQMDTRPGTTVTTFYEFMRDMIHDLGPGWLPGNRRCFTMDNLLAHKHPLVLQLIQQNGHRFVFRAPYYPVDGPIEYVFNTIEQSLRLRVHRIFSAQDLVDNVYEIINSIPDFPNYFHGVGFR